MRDDEPFADKVERLREERETNPEACSHCEFDTSELTNYSKTYGGNVGAHWLCRFCEVTISASALGAGGRPEPAVQDVAAMLHVLERRLHETLPSHNGSKLAGGPDVNHA